MSSSYPPDNDNDSSHAPNPEKQKLLQEEQPDHHHTRNRKLGLAVFACVQNAFVGGLVFGWASIDRTMLKATMAEGGAHLTAAQTTQLFGYASSASMMAPLVLGPLLDAYGPRTCLMVAHMTVLVGCLGFALSQSLWQFTVAVLCMAFGGPGIGLSIIHNANLFPRNQFLAVSMLAGSITLSFSMFAILEVLWESLGISFRMLFGGYTLVIAGSMIGTLLWSPEDPYELEEDDEQDEDDEEALLRASFDSERDYHPTLEETYIEATIQTYAHHHQHHLLLTDQSLNSTLRRRDEDEPNEVADYYEDELEAADIHTATHNENNYHHPGQPQEHTPTRAGRHHRYHRTHSFFQSQEAIQSGNEVAVKLMSLKDQPFQVQVQSPTFSRAVIIFVTTSFLANFTIASLNTEMEDLSQFSYFQQHTLSQQFTWMLSLGMVYAVLVGWLMDRVGLEVCTLFTLVLGQISTALMMVASFPWSFNDTHGYSVMLLGFALYSLFRQFLYPVFLAYITARLGFKYFGILSGVGFALSGMAQYFMPNLAQLIHHGDDGPHQWVHFHIFQICLMGILMVIPIADHRDIQRREAQMERVLEQIHNQQNIHTTTTDHSTPPGLPTTPQSSYTGKISPSSVSTSTTSTASTASSGTHLWKERTPEDILVAAAGGESGYGALDCSE